MLLVMVVVDRIHVIWSGACEGIRVFTIQQLRIIVVEIVSVSNSVYLHGDCCYYLQY